MRGQLSLQDAMRAVDQRLDAINTAQPDDKRLPARKGMSELEAFITLDPLLAQLHRDYLDLKQNCKKAVACDGKRGPMGEVAAEMQDSAWCAMEVRHMELREDRQLMRRAQYLMQHGEPQEEDDECEVKPKAPEAKPAPKKREKHSSCDGPLAWLILHLWLQRHLKAISQANAAFVPA